MSRHDDSVSLRQMLDHAREAVNMAQGRKREDLADDRKLELALTRLIEITGEAAARVSQSGRQRCSRIPWTQIIGMRNRIIHGYDVVDLGILWDVIKEDLPMLITELEQIIK